eukprot:SAG22_NODE_2500_length_2507_cov_3.114203_1_plen_455_part_00
MAGQVAGRGSFLHGTVPGLQHPPTAESSAGMPSTGQRGPLRNPSEEPLFQGSHRRSDSSAAFTVSDDDSEEGGWGGELHREGGSAGLSGELGDLELGEIGPGPRAGRSLSRHPQEPAHEDCATSWRDTWRRFKTWYGLMRTNSFKLRAQRAELVAVQDIMLKGTPLSVVKLLCDMKSRYEKADQDDAESFIGKNFHPPKPSNPPSFRSFDRAEEPPPSFEVVPSRKRTRLHSPQLNKYFCVKQNTPWVQGAEFEQLRRAIEGGGVASRPRARLHAICEEESVDDDFTGPGLAAVLASIPGWEERVDAFGRGSSETFIKLNVEIARLDGVMKSKADLGLRVLTLSCSAIIASGPQIWAFLHEHPDGAGALVLTVVSLACLASSASASFTVYKRHKDGIARDTGYLVQAGTFGTLSVVLCIVAVMLASGDTSRAPAPAQIPDHRGAIGSGSGSNSW